MCYHISSSNCIGVFSFLRAVEAFLFGKILPMVLSERNRQIMKKNNSKLVLNALIILPVFSTMTGAPTATMLALSDSKPVSALVEMVSPDTESEITPEEQARLDKAAKIDAYFGKYDLPLEGYGMKFVIEAEKNNLDWRLLPSIAMAESTGGKFGCHNNPFGWGSCKIKFESYDQAIEVVAWNLGGNNPNTARHYAGKTTSQIIDMYNPPYIVATYNSKIHMIMGKIENTTVPTLTNSEFAATSSAVSEA